ncbi:MAG: methyltransferase domain-containing protein [Candidatus Micrarchaeota archaeon]|nr:methyltransferase domain-containing protein [Candidatus Micrarchaeota archaeon]MDE1860044.1 methyltransferase domain-containing protein [Candidatus Micrarchaeota archaeon]
MQNKNMQKIGRERSQDLRRGLTSNLRKTNQPCSDWAKHLFVDNAHLYANVLEARGKIAEGVAIAGEISEFLASHGIKRGNVLDIPCGTGRVSAPLSNQFGYTVTGVDLSPTLVEMALAKNRNERSRFMVGSMQNLGGLFAEERFDAAINVFTSIGYGTERDDINFFKSLRNFVKDDGIFIIHTLMNREYLVAHFDERPTDYIDAGSLTMYESRTFDRATSRVKAEREFYGSAGEDGLELLGKSSSDMRIYAPSEVAGMLTITGWKVLHVVDDLASMQKVTPETIRFAVVAKRD